MTPQAWLRTTNTRDFVGSVGAIYDSDFLATALQSTLTLAHDPTTDLCTPELKVSESIDIVHLHLPNRHL